MIPERIHRRLNWALSMHDWGYKPDAYDLLLDVARYVTKEGNDDGVETNESVKEENEYGRKGFGFGFCA